MKKASPMIPHCFVTSSNVALVIVLNERPLVAENIAGLRGMKSHWEANLRTIFLKSPPSGFCKFCTFYYTSSLIKNNHMLWWLVSHLEEKRHTSWPKCGPIYSCQKYPLLSISLVLPLPFFSLGAEDRKSPQRLGSPSESLMDVRCL